MLAQLHRIANESNAADATGRKRTKHTTRHAVSTPSAAATRRKAARSRTPCARRRNGSNRTGAAAAAARRGGPPSAIASTALLAGGRRAQGGDEGPALRAARPSAQPARARCQPPLPQYFTALQQAPRRCPASPEGRGSLNISLSLIHI